MRVIFIASRWDYGDPARGPSFEETTFRSALQGMGHDVLPFDFVEREQAVGRERMNRELREFVLENDPDLAFFFLFRDEIAFDTIRSLTADGVRTVNWFADDHWRFENFSRHYAPAFSLVATTDADAIPKYAATGYGSVVLTQWAFNKYGPQPSVDGLQHYVTFVGQAYGDRPKTIRALRRAELQVDCWGMGWKNGRLSHEEMADVFATSRVNLNLGGAYRGRLGRRRPAQSQIKARPFEILGCGGFLLTDRAPRLAEYLSIGEELAAFEDRADLVRQATRWLEREDERRAIARAGRERVLAEHTYDHRFAEIFARVCD